MMLCQTFIPLMKKNHYGRIINLSSGMGQLTHMDGKCPAYRISKTAINALTRIAAQEVCEDNILVNSMCPGWVKTDMGGPGATRELEEGAASLGAGFRQRFFGIIIPNCRSGILAGALMTFTLSIGEFNLTWMLHTPLTKTLPVGLADSYASMRLEVASAYTLIFFILIVPVLILMQALTNRRF